MSGVGILSALYPIMQTNKTVWQEMGYSWRDGNGVVECRRSLAMVDPFARTSPFYHSLASTARNIRIYGGQ